MEWEGGKEEGMKEEKEREHLGVSSLSPNVPGSIKMVPVLASMPPTWKTQLEFQSPSFNPAQLQLLAATRDENQQLRDTSLSAFPSFAVIQPFNNEINYFLKERKEGR